MDVSTGNSDRKRDMTPHSSAPDPVTAGLRQMFAAIADEPIPDDFLRLLDDIEASSKGVAQ